MFDKFQSMYATIVLSSYFTCWANLFWFCQPLFIKHSAFSINLKWDKNVFSVVDIRPLKPAAELLLFGFNAH